jgi:hypothetical protein
MHPQPAGISPLHPHQPHKTYSGPSQRTLARVLPGRPVMRVDSARPQEDIQSLEGGTTTPQQVTDRARGQNLRQRAAAELARL